MGVCASSVAIVNLFVFGFISFQFQFNCMWILLFGSPKRNRIKGHTATMATANWRIKRITSFSLSKPMQSVNLFSMEFRLACRRLQNTRCWLLLNKLNPQQHESNVFGTICVVHYVSLVCFRVSGASSTLSLSFNLHCLSVWWIYTASCLRCWRCRCQSRALFNEAHTRSSFTIPSHLIPFQHIVCRRHRRSVHCFVFLVLILFQRQKHLQLFLFVCLGTTYGWDMRFCEWTHTIDIFQRQMAMLDFVYFANLMQSIMGMQSIGSNTKIESITIDLGATMRTQRKLCCAKSLWGACRVSLVSIVFDATQEFTLALWCDSFDIKSDFVIMKMFFGKLSRATTLTKTMASRVESMTRHHSMTADVNMFSDGMCTLTPFLTRDTLRNFAVFAQQIREEERGDMFVPLDLDILFGISLQVPWNESAKKRETNFDRCAINVTMDKTEDTVTAVAVVAKHSGDVRLRKKCATDGPGKCVCE